MSTRGSKKKTNGRRGSCEPPSLFFSSRLAPTLPPPRGARAHPARSLPVHRRIRPRPTRACACPPRHPGSFPLSPSARPPPIAPPFPPKDSQPWRTASTLRPPRRVRVEGRVWSGSWACGAPPGRAAGRGAAPGCRETERRGHRRCLTLSPSRPLPPTPPPGEIHEFREDLRSLDKGRKKEAVKKVIAAMTVGKVRDKKRGRVFFFHWANAGWGTGACRPSPARAWRLGRRGQRRRARPQRG